MYAIYLQEVNRFNLIDLKRKEEKLPLSSVYGI